MSDFAKTTIMDYMEDDSFNQVVSDLISSRGVKITSIDSEDCDEGVLYLESGPSPSPSPSTWQFPFDAQEDFENFCKILLEAVDAVSTCKSRKNKCLTRNRRFIRTDI